MATLHLLARRCTKPARLLQGCIFACLIFSLLTVACTTLPPAPGNSTPTPTPTCPDPEKTPPELRAAWVATVTNIDWPSKPGLSVDTQKQEFINILNQLQRMHMNAVVVQIKPTADAFYPSRYWPWSQYLTGKEGQDPGYDPLVFMLQEAHSRHIEFHAWFNPYRVSMHDSLDQLAPNNPARQHPDWVVSYGGKLYFDPGIPAARTFIIDSIREVVDNYDIDAVHFDDYFYSSRVGDQDFPDEATYQKYGAAQFANKGDWRRNNVNQLIEDLWHMVKASKPAVRIGISPFGVWRNKAVDPTGSDTQASLTNYDDLYADTRTWIRRGWLDYIAPQLYWNIGFAPAAYEKLVPWWVNEVASSNVHLYIGQAVYKIGSPSGPWSNADEMPNQLHVNRQFKAVRGSLFFSMKDLLANRLGFTDRLINDIYKCVAQPDA